MSDPFTADAISTVARHMNEDHASDCLVICQGLGARPQATEAAMVDMGPSGIAFAIDGGERVTVPWSEPVTQRHQVRSEVTAMCDRARRTLEGPSPDPSAPHE